ncbi:CD82 antigen-like [Myripristis murdjan]|uniref:Tetraspanin n=1 Tax=Myripristis murdjan TaxID=586833 RepID=A0A667XX58_9TELE|nr:CD82 antigen-like [Myripristis murdjan]XP_029904160.1 CD82 antigen-like [Myripristis murdjan]
MGKGCITATKYFLFLFNLLYFLFGAILMGFGLWILLDNQSFLIVLKDSMALKVACYILIGVGAFSMLLSFLGCLGAIYEIRCLLGLYFTCLLLILIAQIAAGALIYLQKEMVNEEMSKIVTKVIENFYGNDTATEKAWNFVQMTMECCGWDGRADWSGNMVIVNSSQLLFPCSCQNRSDVTANYSHTGFCEASTPDWPVYDVGCSSKVESWLLTNIGIVLGICLGVAVIELLGMILSICLCRNVHTEEYTKVPKY